MEKSIFSSKKKKKKYFKNIKNINQSLNQSFPQIEKSHQKCFPNTRSETTKKTLRIETIMRENIL